MKFKFLVLFWLFLFIGKQNIFSQTIVPAGVVSGTWDLAGSPYLIQGGIMIANGTTLTIEPGVTVDFQGSYLFLVMGTLLAEGTPADSIKFTASNTSIGWLGIRFDNTANTNSESRFFYCIVEYGRATAAAPNNSGGGFYFDNYSNAVISNSRISNCYASFFGGGICCINGSSPLITDNIISQNIGNGGGGGIYCYGNCNPTISNNEISENSIVNSGAGGGGIYAYDYSSPTIINNYIHNNSSGRGGGIFIVDGSGVISKNRIVSNQALNSIGGGGIFTGSGGVNESIDNNIIANNNAFNSVGGGMYCSSESTIQNNLFINNNATTNGGAISFYSSSAKLVNNTISNNTSPLGNSFYFTNNSDNIIRNTIFWNVNSSSHFYLNDDTSDPIIHYCNLQGGVSGIQLNTNVFYLGANSNNIDLDPLFIMPTSGGGPTFDGLNADWSIAANSPCIDAGDTSGTYPATDIANNPRVSNGIIDIGAYEVLFAGIENQTDISLLEIYPNPSNGNYTFQIISKKTESINILLYDLNGKLLDQVNWNVIQGNNILQSNWSNLSYGVYFAKIIGETSEMNVKLVVN